MFKAFISLGWACVTAASMEKYGLRDGSYPFDWVWSQFYGVLHFLENDFEDFLLRDHLSVDGEHFYDRKWGIDFIHDGSIAKSEDYAAVCAKYRRRIDRFRKTTKDGNICFIRCVRNREEVRWIKENRTYISRIINKFPQSKIVFVLHKGLGRDIDLPFDCYTMDLYGWMGDTRYQLRSTFDTNKDFISYCQGNCPKQKLEDNLKFDARKEAKYIEQDNGISREKLEKLFIHIVDNKNKQICVEQSRVNRILQIAKSDFRKLSKDKTYIIYGAGDIGKLLADKIKAQVKIKCFLDRKPEENEYCKIPIYRPQEYVYDEKSLIVVVPSYDYDVIATDLEKTYGINVRMISLEDFCTENLKL